MSVLCCRIPDFLIALACRQSPHWRDRPLALVGPDEYLWAVSAQARRWGVQIQMRPQRAQAYCPDILFQPLDVSAVQGEQQAFLAALAAWELPVEPQIWGMAYVDLHAVATTAQAVQPLAAELGRRVRNLFDKALQPTLGWDSGKFTARVAAVRTMPGRMRLVDKQDEVNFLSPLPITLLPLPQPHLQQLYWLGIRTLGQFAALPTAAVWQRFGAAGKLAQRWAQGRDERPVSAAVHSTPSEVTILLDTPTGLFQPVVDVLAASLRPLLAELSTRLEGLRRLRVRLGFVDGTAQTVDLTFVEPVGQPGRAQNALVQKLGTLSWPAPVQETGWTVLEVGELLARQLTLFDPSFERLAPLDTLAQKLASRYGPLFFQGQVHDPKHPLSERRSRFIELEQR